MTPRSRCKPSLVKPWKPLRNAFLILLMEKKFRSSLNNAMKSRPYRNTEGIVMKSIHCLNDEELQRLWLSLEASQNQKVANALRLLLLTGSRQSDVLKRLGINSTWK